MAHLPMDDARVLFADNKQMSWSGLMQVFQARKGKAEGISDTLITMLMPAVQQAAQANQPYPDSPDGLYNELNRMLTKVTATAQR